MQNFLKVTRINLHKNLKMFFIKFLMDEIKKTLKNSRINAEPKA